MVAWMAVIGYANEMQGRLIAAARSLLGWSQDELARRANIARKTLVGIERESGNPKRASERAVVEILEAEGVRFEETSERITVSLIRRPRS